MKKITLLLIIPLLAIALDGWGQIISQYIETNSGSVPKGVEIWNNTASALDFSTNNLEIWKGTNGAAPAVDYTLSSGTLAVGAVIVIGTSDLQTVTEANGSVFYLKAFTFNGDDALEVWYGTTKTDVFGDPGTGDPGSGWSGNGVQTWNQNIQLLSGITTGDTDGWTDPSLRFETVSTNPSGTGGDVGFGIAPAGDGVEDPAAFVATAFSTAQIDLTFTTNTDGDNVVIVYNADGTFTDPSGAPPAVGQAFAGGTLLYNGTTSPQNHTALNNNETVYYKAWSYDNTDYSSGLISNATTYQDEPSNHVTSFDAATGNSTTIDLIWTENDGAVVPDGYLIIANTGAITDPVDGTDPIDDTDLTDGAGNIEVAHGNSSYSFTNCSSSTTYNFSIYPYTNSGAAVDFKTVPSAPTDAATTDAAAAEPTAGDLIITEVSGDGTNGNNSDDNGFMEIYNASAVELSLANVEARYYNSNPGASTQQVTLSGSIAAGAFIIVTQNAVNFQTEYGIAADFSGSQFYFNGGDDGCDVYHTTNGVLDQFNDNGTGQAPWTWDDDFSWDRNSTASGDIQSSWTANSTGNPKVIGLTVWVGGTSTSWTDDDNWTFFEPASTTNVSIPTGVSNYPTLIAAGAVCYNLLIESGASLVGVNYLTVSGTATIERSIDGYTGASDGFHFLSSPVASFTIAGSDFEPLLGTDDFFGWDETTNTWLNYYGTLSDTDFEVGKGYLVAYNPTNTGSFVGSLNSAAVPKSLSYTPGQGNGWNLLGNPYPSAIDWDLLSKSTSVNGSVYVLRGSDNTYVSWNGTSGDLSGGEIPVNNGFFVKADATSQSVTIDPADQVHSTSSFLKSADEAAENTLMVSIADDEFTSNAYIQFRPDGTTEFDNAIDAYKLFGSSDAPQLYTLLSETEYSINCLPFTEEHYTLPMGFLTGAANKYTISADGFHSFTNNSFEVSLEDLETGDIVNLENETYTFTSNPDTDDSRFVLHFYGAASTGETPELLNGKIYTYRNNVYVQLNNDQTGNYQVEVINMVGQQVYSNDFATGGLNSFKLNEKPGVYFVRLRAENKTMVQKVMISK